LFREWHERVVARIDEERRRGTTLIVVEHERALIRDHADSVVFLEGGRKVAEGSAGELLSGE
jgi:ABC-type branched-subunit amino acid transport system ATPase component